MTKVEQAIFTSAKTDHAVGYQVISHSPGVHHVDVRELAVWCPSHDSLLDRGPDSASINFHPLPSGAFCVSRTVPAGVEYSGRGGIRVYTHCLIVPPEALAHFANNPFEILHAALSAGAMEIRDPVPRTWSPCCSPAGPRRSINRCSRGLSLKAARRLWPSWFKRRSMPYAWQ